MRVHLTGGAASGKTTLANRLSAELGLKVFNLDDAGYDPAMSDADRTLRRKSLLADVLSNSGSITEGAFIDWAEPFFECADVIVFLNVPRSVALRRVVARHLRASLRGANKYKGLRRLFRFVRATNGWYTSRRTHDEVYGLPPGTTGVTHVIDLRKVLSRFGSKLVVCNTEGDVEAFARSIAQRNADGAG